VQVAVDEHPVAGSYVLTGSANFALLQSIGQSLAGRTALLELLPLSLQEIRRFPKPPSDLFDLLWRGSYPALYDRNLAPGDWYPGYVSTYLERDVRTILNVGDLVAFQTFLRLCAGRVGQLLNLHGLGNDTGVSHTTVRQWISVLEASYIVFLLQPFHASISKRLIKSPKLYFYDVGLASYLLGIETARQVTTHPLKGFLFENMVVVEALKHRFNQGRRSNLSFYRDSSRTEVDLIYSLADRILAVEIKAGETVSRSFLSSLRKLRGYLPEQIAGEILVHGAENEMVRDQVRVTGPVGFVATLADLEREVLG